MKVMRTIFTAGLLAGILDITAAFILFGLRGVTPDRILQSVAAGLLGPGAFKGGAKTAALGAVLHFVIATGAAAVYVLASRRLDALVRHPVPLGLLYGIAVYLVMTFVVVPLSAATRRPFVLDGTAVIMVLIHMGCVGLPIALVASRFSPPETEARAA